MAADKHSTPRDRLATIEKALRRSKKLEKSLLKIVAQSDPGSDAETFLKAVRQGAKALKKERKKAEQPAAPVVRKTASRQKPAPKPAERPENASVTVRRSRRKEPAPANPPVGEESAAS